MEGEIMENSTVIRFGLILAIQAEIEGMKITNMERAADGLAFAYDEAAFYEMAQRLETTARCHEEQL